MKKRPDAPAIELSRIPPLERRKLLLARLDALRPGEMLELHSPDHPLPLLGWLADERLAEFSGTFRRDDGHGWLVRLRK